MTADNDTTERAATHDSSPADSVSSSALPPVAADQPAAGGEDAPARVLLEAAPAPIHHAALAAAEGEAALATGDAEAATAERPSQRIQIGSQRDGDDATPAVPKPVTPGPVNADRPPEQQKRKSYPPPNVRAKLPPELEKELEAALAGGSVNELMESSTDASATAELAPETRVKARVASVHEEDVFFEIGGRNQGIAQLKQFETPPEVGAELDLMVQRFDAEQGLYEVSLPSAAVSVGNWDEVQTGQIVEVVVSAANKGGLECTVAGIRGFIPMGQISMFRVENAPDYVGQRLACVITEANRGRKNLVLSHRAVMERERKENREKLLTELSPGQLREGIVRSLQDFGAFVDLGGVDGLIHVSQMSWERIAHPSEVLQVGQTVKVRIEKINAETGKIGLSYQDRGDNPWEHAASKYGVGARIKGTVSKLMQFGAFVKLEPGVEGLIHISELGHGRVFRTSDVLSEGQEVEAKVLAVDVEAQRISLSLKALLPPPERPVDRRDELPEGPIATPRDAPRPDRRRKHDDSLKGGVGGPTGGEKFGLKW